MPSLLAPVCSIAPTRRRRFLWVAWWTGPPTREPFRKPDAFEGGARSRREALAEAERAAAMHLVEIESRWARAWARVLVGQPPWMEKDAAAETASSSGRQNAETTGTHPGSVWSILGVTAGATAAELRRAFRQRALETHPDKGGTADSFRLVQRAYEEALRRISRPRKRRR